MEKLERCTNRCLSESGCQVERCVCECLYCRAVLICVSLHAGALALYL